MIRSMTIAAVICLAAGAAGAATLTTPIEYTGPFGTDVPGAGVVNLPLFNASLGTLTAVTVSELGSFSGGANLLNNGHMADSFTFNIGGEAGVDILSSDPSAAAADLKAHTFNTSMPSKSYSLAKSATGVYGPYLVLWGSSDITGLPVKDFEKAGGGAVKITFDETSYPVDSPKKIELNDVFYSEQNLQATARLQATYTYTPFRAIRRDDGVDFGIGGSAVPEPAAWATMLVGLFGMGAVLRNTRSKPFAA